jgi:type VI secretion system protein ImpL
MKRMLGVLLSLPVLGTLALLALSAIVWWIGPLVAIDTWRPLAGAWWRALVIGLMWLAWLLRLGLGVWRRRRAQAALVEGIAAPASADREAQVLAKRFRDAIARLKTAQGANKKWFSRSPSLYDMPWYVFVGAPGSGKTTALLNAGLQFVMTEEGAAVQGVGGTRNCDWWFTREAVLIDTAGRYALQESDKRVDAAAWDNFLSLLRKTRPRRPINGVLLTVNVQELLQQGAAERAEHAAKLRARLLELQAKLGVQPPVYVMVTKADLVAGFAETFDTLGKEERDQVWGFSFDARSEADPPLRGLDLHVRALLERLSAGLLQRMQEERDSTRRAAIFGFVQEFGALQPLLADFLNQVFIAGGALQEPVRVRGVYFTSGTQEGTPIERVMGGLARSFGLERRVAPAPVQRGRSYFLRRLLQDVVFPEAHLVSFNARAERRRFARRLAGFAVVALLAIALGAGWGISYLRNRNLDAQVAARVPALREAVDALPPATSGDLAPLLSTLSSVRDAAKPDGYALADPPLPNTLGLYQGAKLDAGAQAGYRKLLEHAMLPRIARRLEERLRASSKDNLEQAYEALKGYLMLYTPERFDAGALRAWIALDWDTQLRHLAPEQRAALDAHLDALFAQGAPQAVVPMDGALVGSVREMLASFPLEYRVYSRIKRRYRTDLPDFSVASAAGPNAPKVFERASGQPLSRGVPGLYTRDGYAKAFQGTVAGAAAQLAGEEDWVLGKAGGAARAATAAAGVGERVRRLYLQDYIKTWDDFLADVRLVPLTSLERSIEVSRLLAGVDSPLSAYLRAVARETTLVPPQQPAAGALAPLNEAARKAKDELAKLADPQAAPTTGGPVERMVDDHFAPLHRMVQGQPAPVDEVQKSFGEVASLLQAVDAAQKTKSPPPAGGADKVKNAAAGQPEPVRSMLESLADAGMKQGRVAERDSLTGELKPVYDFCSRAISNRYPFATGSRADVLPEDFGQLFGGGGMLDEFYQRRLAALVDTSGATWTYKPLADGSRPPAPPALADFQRAARIREVFFRGGGRTPGFRLDLRAVELDPALQELVLDVDGQTYRFAPGNTAPVTLSWPSPRVASQVRLSAASGGEPLLFEGPWALFRLFDRFEVQPSGQPERFGVLVNLGGKRARLEVTANSVFNPFRLREIQQFRCPGAL